MTESEFFQSFKIGSRLKGSYKLNGSNAVYKLPEDSLVMDYFPIGGKFFIHVGWPKRVSIDNGRPVDHYHFYAEELQVIEDRPVLAPVLESKSVCECGTKSPTGQNHSGWCKLYVREIA